METRLVHLGHPMETLHYPEKLGLVKAYYLGELPEDWFSTLPIRWVVYGPYEKELARDFRPAPDLVPAFERKDMTIYRVK